MNKTSNINIENNTQPLDKSNSTVVSKSALIAEFIGKPDVYQLIGKAWLLYFRLLLVEKGILVTTYGQIGMELGASGNTVKDWVEHLVKQRVLEKNNKGKQVELRLMGEHMIIANAPDYIEVVKEVHGKAMSPRAEELGQLLEIVDRTGSQIEMKWLYNGRKS